ncbi:MAG TPA: RHS repeat-associated core domain-containing protein [Holophagaceae bacterium]
MFSRRDGYGLGLLAVFLAGIWGGSSLAAQTAPCRLINPQTTIGYSSGWRVAPATGALGWSLPVGVVPGDIPIPVVYRYQASVMSDLTQSITYTRNPDGTSTPHYSPVQRYRGIWGSLNFGFITPSTGSTSGVPEDGTQVLEDGTLFRDSEWSTPAPDGSSLPKDFGFNAPAGGYALDSSGSYGLYSASLADLGTWSTKVSQLTTASQFKVLMDRNRARVYAYQATLRDYVPVLWVDRFGHWVSFQWQQGTWSGMTSFTVTALNPSGKGVQVAWAIQSGSTSTVVDLLRADFIGVSAPSLLVQGYWGAPTLLPVAMGTPIATLRPMPLAVGGPIGRPTLIRMGPPSGLSVPGYVPSLPAPPTATAPEADWTFGYQDTNLAELNSITDPLGVKTTLTFQTIAFPNDAPYVRGVTSAASADSVTGASHSQNWSFAVPTTGANWTTTYTEGYSDGSATEGRTIVYGFSTANAAIQSLQVQGASGNTQTTNYDLTSTGEDGSLTTPNGTHVISTGKPKVDISTTLAVKTSLPTGEYLTVGGTAVQSTTTAYNPLSQYLDQAQPTSTTITRLNLATNANLPAIVTAATYTTKGEPTKASVQAGGQEKGQTYSYDADGRLSHTGILASWAADVSLGTSYVSSPLGPTSATTSGNNISPSLNQGWTYNDAGAVASHADAQGNTATYTFDLRGRVLSVAKTGDPTLTYSYPSERTRTWSQGRVSGSETYDGFGRLQSRLRGDGVTETYTYDTYGRRVAVHEISGGTSRTVRQTSYDALDRLISEQPASGPGSSFAYSASGVNQVVTITMTNGLTYTQTRDPWGQVVASTDPTGTTTTAVYNEFGQATQVTQSNGGVNQVRSFSYDGIGNLVSRTEPETHTTTFSGFNAQGAPGSIANTSRTLTLSYDALGRRRSVVNGGASLSYTYTGTFLTGMVSSDGVSQGFSYNGPGGRLSGESLTIDGVVRTIGYGYDGNSTLATITYPSGRIVGYGYDALNRVNQITNNGGLLASVGYDGWGNRTSLAFASGASSQWTPDAYGLHLMNWTVTYAGGGDSRSYQYDPSDHLTQAGEWSLQHDKMGQLNSASGFGISAAYSYDGFGNNTTNTVSIPAPPTFNAFGFNPLVDNRITGLQTNGGATGWMYADNGEASQIATAVSSGRYLSMGWDAFGRVASVTDSQTAAVQNYRYAPSGLRATLTDASDGTRNRQYLYTNGGLLLGEYLANGSWKRDAIYLGDQAIAEVDVNGVHELHSDYLGTPRVITTGSTGAVEGRQAFGPYGELIGTPTYTYGYQPLTGYTGHVQTDATGLIYMRGRYYSPAWHRFLNSDQGVDPNQFNQFAYAGGSPMMATDPSGMQQRYFVTIGDQFYIAETGGVWQESIDANGNSYLYQGNNWARGWTLTPVGSPYASSSSPGDSQPALGLQAGMRGGSGASYTPQTPKPKSCIAGSPKQESLRHTPGTPMNWGIGAGSFAYTGRTFDPGVGQVFVGGIVEKPLGKPANYGGLFEASAGDGLNGGYGNIQLYGSGDPGSGSFWFGGGKASIPLLGGVSVGVAVGNDWFGVYIDKHVGWNETGVGLYVCKE